MKRVLITGASSGIGAATARLFDSRGYQTVITGRSEERLKSVAESLKNECEYHACDLNNPSQIADLLEKVYSKGSIDVLVNNAAIAKRELFDSATIETWRSQFETNVFGLVEITLPIYKKMTEERSGCIINVSSNLGQRSIPEMSAYSASKAAVNSLTESLAREAASHNVRVNAVLPGIVETPIHTGKDLTDQERDFMNGLTPIGRIGRPEEIAESILFLVESEWSTGTLLKIDGGISL